MQKRKNVLVRIPLEEVPRFLREQKTPASSEHQSQDVEVDNGVRATRPKHTENAQKHPSAGKRNLRTEESDRSLGLWINMDMFRRQHQQQARIILHDPRPGTNNRYLALADLALKNRRRPSKNANNVDAENAARIE
jgi:hypothetical protein